MNQILIRSIDRLISSTRSNNTSWCPQAFAESNPFEYSNIFRFLFVIGRLIGPPISEFPGIFPRIDSYVFDFLSFSHMIFAPAHFWFPNRRLGLWCCSWWHYSVHIFMVAPLKLAHFEMWNTRQHRRSLNKGECCVCAYAGKAGRGRVAF